MMRKLCPNLDREDGLETVLEVPIAEEMIGAEKGPWHSVRAWMRPPISPSHHSRPSMANGRSKEIQLLLGVVGAPLIPRPVPLDVDCHPIHHNVNDLPIEESMAKYIVQQYVAAVGGKTALNGVESMYAMGKVRMATSECSFREPGNFTNKVAVKGKTSPGAEMGSFVLWNKRPDLWCLELLVSGCKISAGSDGKVAWRQTPWHHSHSSRGPPRPLRRFIQGLDPKLTASLFWNSVCVGEKTVDEEDCFLLKLEAESTSLLARSSSGVELIRHTVLGCFSQKTGLLVQLEDSHLLRINANGKDNDIFWETTMESTICDYKTIDGVNIAHGGKTAVTLFRFGEPYGGHSLTRMEEVWTVEEFELNVKGLTMDCFLPPSDLKKVDERCGPMMRLPLQIRSASMKMGGSTVAIVRMGNPDDGAGNGQL